MPLGPGVKYRMKGSERLAFKGGTVVEAKNMKSGKVHTPQEFAADRAAGNGGQKPHQLNRAHLIEQVTHNRILQGLKG